MVNGAEVRDEKPVPQVEFSLIFKGGFPWQLQGGEGREAASDLGTRGSSEADSDFGTKITFRGRKIL